MWAVKQQTWSEISHMCFMWWSSGVVVFEIPSLRERMVHKSLKMSLMWNIHQIMAEYVSECCFYLFIFFKFFFSVSCYEKPNKAAGRHRTVENKVRRKSAKSLQLNSHRGRALRGSEVTVMVLVDTHSAKICSLSSFL